MGNRFNHWQLVLLLSEAAMHIAARKPSTDAEGEQA